MTKIGTRDLKSLNELALFTSADYTKKLNALTTLCQALSSPDLLWGFAFSFSLFVQGGYDSFNDFDLLIRDCDGSKILDSLEEAGAEVLPENQKGVFSSPFYREAYLDGIHLDIIGKCTVNTFNTSYFYDVCREEIRWIYLQKGIAVPVVPVEACLVLYGMMVGWQANRQFKVDLCVKYLEENGVKYPQIFQNALENFNLPEFLKAVLVDLLEKN